MLNTNVIVGSLICLFGIIISSFAQILLKKSSQIQYNNKISEYLNLKVITAYIIFVSATFLSVIAYRKITLSFGLILGTSEYIFISILSFLFFKEKISKNTLLGLCFIIIGIFIFAL